MEKLRLEITNRNRVLRRVNRRQRGPIAGNNRNVRRRVYDLI